MEAKNRNGRGVGAVRWPSVVRWAALGGAASLGTSHCDAPLSSPLPGARPPSDPAPLTRFLGPGGGCCRCGFELAKLQEKGCIIGFFPLHDIGAKITLEKRWLAITSLPSQQPMDMIKDYFGEKVRARAPA